MAGKHHGALPPGVEMQRTTGELDGESVPAGLMRAHRLAPGVWGRLRVSHGTLGFVWEDTPDDPVALLAGDTLVIPPEVPHHVEPDPDVRFSIEFHR